MKRYMVVAACAVAVIQLNAAAGAAGKSTLEIVATPNGVKNLGGFHPNRNPELGAAIDTFGQPSSRDVRYLGNGCRARWNGIGLQIHFFYYGGGSGTACEPSIGLAQSAVIKGKHARWAAGEVGIGTSVDGVLEAFPRAERHGRSFWLATGYTEIGEGGEYPVLSAVIGAGKRVNAFRLSIGAAGD